MGLTISDRNQKIYSSLRENGMKHKEVIASFPKHKRDQLLIDLEKDSIESHFGMKPLPFLVMTLVVIVGSIIFGLYFG